MCFSCPTSRNAVRPLYSCDKQEAKRRVLNLYKLWCRQIPWIVRRYDIVKNQKQVRDKLKEEFMRHKDTKDVRQIDLLVAIGHQDYEDTIEVWRQKGHMMKHFWDTVEPKPCGFKGRFFLGLR